MIYTLRAHELPPYTSIYLIDSDGSRSHVGEVISLNGEKTIMRVSDGEMVRVLRLCDERAVEIDTFGGPFPSREEDAVDVDVDEPDPEAADKAADAYERGLDAICDRRFS